MLNIGNIVGFSKNGDNLNMLPNGYINITINSKTGRQAQAYAPTIRKNVDGVDKIYVNGNALIVDCGYGFTDTNDIILGLNNVIDEKLNVTFSTDINSPYYCDYEIGLKDVYVNGELTKGIDYIHINSLWDGSKLTTDNIQYPYPSIVYTSSIYMPPISTDLVETETIYWLYKNGDSYVFPYDTDSIYFNIRTNDDENNIRFFEVDEITQEINWFTSYEYNLNIDEYKDKSIPLPLNIGFISSEEGVYQSTIEIYFKSNGQYTLYGEIIVGAESIGEDERYRTIFANFGVPDPATYVDIFKESNINEPVSDNILLNYKSKELFLEYSNIFPFVGTYKALINAVKYLGYDDIYFREWYKKRNNDINKEYRDKISFIVSYNAKDRAQTLMSLSQAERENLIKLNRLTMVYLINKDTGNVDEYGIPITENTYVYNISEMYAKLLALKDWLEKHIIGINCRIKEITGEGVYYEVFKNNIYATQNQDFDSLYKAGLTPYFIGDCVDLRVPVDVSSNLYEYNKIGMSLYELSLMSFKDLKFTPFRYFVDSVFDKDNNAYLPYDLIDTSIYNSNDYLNIGATARFPTKIKNVQYEYFVKKNSYILNSPLVSSPLLIDDNDISLLDKNINRSDFNISNNISFIIEEGYLRENNEDVDYENNIVFTLGTTEINDTKYFSIMKEGDTNPVLSLNNIIITPQDISTSLFYYSTLNYQNIPYFIIKGYKGLLCDVRGNNSYYIFENNDNSNINNEYILDIRKGKIVIDEEIENTYYNSITNKNTYIEIGYKIDNDNNKEKTIEVDTYYTTPNIPLYQYDVSTYLVDEDNSLSIDNSVVYSIPLSYTGTYGLVGYGWDMNNILYKNNGVNNVYVHEKYPNIYISSNQNEFETSNIVDSDVLSETINDDSFPIFDKYLIYEVKKVDAYNKGKNNLHIRPDYNSVTTLSKSYLSDTPDVNDYIKFYNTGNRIINITNVGNKYLIRINFGFKFGHREEYGAIKNITKLRINYFNKNNYTLVDLEDVNVSFYDGKDGLYPNDLPDGDNDSYSFFINNKLSDLSTKENIISNAVVTENNLFSINKFIKGIINISKDDDYNLYQRDCVLLVGNTSTPEYNSFIDLWGTKDDYQLSSYDVSADVVLRNTKILIEDISAGNITYGATHSVLSLDVSLPMATAISDEFGYDVNDIQNSILLRGYFPSHHIGWDTSTYLYEMRFTWETYSEMSGMVSEVHADYRENNDYYLDVKVDDPYRYLYYMDRGFMFSAFKFNTDIVNDNWIEIKNDDKYWINNFLEGNNEINCLLFTKYSNVNYMPVFYNKWSVLNRDTSAYEFVVYNKNVPYTFTDNGIYDLTLDTYDENGNKLTQYKPICEIK